MPDAAPAEHGRRVWNALQALDPEGRVATACDKFHLVPFGEYVPLRGLLPGGGLAAGALDFSRGPGPRTLSVPGPPPFSPLICYEAIFPGAVVDPALKIAAWVQVSVRRVKLAMASTHPCQNEFRIAHAR